MTSLLPQALQDWIDGSKSVNILLTGKTGAGKSALVNSIVGAEVAPEGHGLDPETKAVTPFEVEINGVEITVWDSPGLQDGTSNEKCYFEDMKRRCNKYDLVLYCTSMKDARFTEDDRRAMGKLTQAFGENFWKNVVVVITYANEYAAEPPRPTYAEKCKQFQQKISQFLKENLKIAARVAEAVPVVPAGCIIAGKPTSRQLPNCQDWLSALWYVAILRMKESALPAMVKASKSRIKSTDSITEEDLKEPGPKQPIAVVPAAVMYGFPYAVMVALGALLGWAVAGRMGVAARGAAGAAAATAVITYFYS